MADQVKREMRMDILLDQVDRLHEVLAIRQQARMRSMGWGAATMLVLLVLGYTRSYPIAALALPFAVVFLMVQYAYYTHLVMYARTVLSEAEARVNSELGEPLLQSEALEARESGPLGESHLLGLSPGNIGNLSGFVTLHYLFLSAIVFLAGMFRSQYILGEPDLSPVKRLGEVYTPVLFIWTVINILYVVWFSWGEREKGFIAAIRKQLQSKSE